MNSLRMIRTHPDNRERRARGHELILDGAGRRYRNLRICESRIMIPGLLGAARRLVGDGEIVARLLGVGVVRAQDASSANR